MKYNTIFFSLVILICLIVIIGYLIFKKEWLVVGGYQIAYFKLSDSLDYKAKQSLDLNQAMKDVISAYGLNNILPAQNYFKSNFVLWETLNNIDSLVAKTLYPKDVAYVYGIAGTDKLASKSNLCYYLRNALKPEVVDEIIPKTYILVILADRDKFINEFRRNKKVYILKKNLQRQEGHFITDNFDAALSKINDDSERAWVVAQEMLQDPYIISGRKVNLRIYFLITVSETGNVDFYIYKNGFMYYTAKEFIVNSVLPEHIITTGYIDRQVYKDNPLTLFDLKKYMGDDMYLKMFDKILALFSNLKKAYAQNLYIDNKNIPGNKFLVYGCDIAPDKNLNVKIMEINKGPDLSYKDDRDKQVKFNMMRDAFNIMGMVRCEEVNDFVRI